MPTRLPSLRRPPIGFAHRGARAHAPENTLEAFALAVRLGATGLESDVWLTRDGEAVLDHDGVVRQGLRKRRIAELDRADLPEHIPTLEELYAAVGTELDISLDVKDAGGLRPHRRRWPGRPAAGRWSGCGCATTAGSRWRPGGWPAPRCAWWTRPSSGTCPRARAAGGRAGPLPASTP